MVVKYRLKFHWFFLYASCIGVISSCKSTNSAEPVTFDLSKTFEVRLPANTVVGQDILTMAKIDISDTDLKAHNTSLSKITSIKLSSLNFLDYSVDTHERMPTPNYFIDTLKLFADPVSLAVYNTTSTSVTDAEFSAYAKNPNNQFFAHTLLQHSPSYDVMARFNYVMTITADKN